MHLFGKVSALPLWVKLLSSVVISVFALVVVGLFSFELMLLVVAIIVMVAVLVLVVAIFALIIRALQHKSLQNWGLVILISFLVLLGGTTFFIILLFNGLGQGGAPSPSPKQESTTPLPSPPVDPLAEVDRAMRESLTKGSVAFNTPEEMQLGKAETVQLLLSPSDSGAELQQQITEAGKTEAAEIRVSNRMQARLTGPGFQIEAISPEEQAISSTDTTEWKWDVTPTKTGENQELHLTLTALIDVEGQETPRQIRTFDRTIDVPVTWGQRFGVIGTFITTNWQWFWTVILVPIALWLYRKYRKQKSGDGGEGEEKPPNPKKGG